MDTPFGSFDFGSSTPASAPDFSANTPFGAFGLGSDLAEAQQLQPFIPQAAQQQGMAWWESVIAYGATRAIDNKFGPTNIQGNTDAGSFAGQNGRTYSNRPTVTGGTPAARSQVQSAQQANGLGTLAALAAAVFAFM